MIAIFFSLDAISHFVSVCSDPTWFLVQKFKLSRNSFLFIRPQKYIYRRHFCFLCRGKNLWKFVWFFLSKLFILQPPKSSSFRFFFIKLIVIVTILFSHQLWLYFFFYIFSCVIFKDFSLRRLFYSSQHSREIFQFDLFFVSRCVVGQHFYGRKLIRVEEWMKREKGKKRYNKRKIEEKSFYFSSQFLSHSLSTFKLETSSSSTFISTWTIVISLKIIWWRSFFIHFSRHLLYFRSVIDCSKDPKNPKKRRGKRREENLFIFM